MEATTTKTKTKAGKKNAGANGKAKATSAAADEPKVAETFSRELRCRLSKPEQADLAVKLTDLMNQRDNLEAEADGVRKEFKSKIDALEPDIATLQRDVNEGRVDRPVKCEEVHDFRRGKVFVRRTDTGETVEGTERAMAIGERQQKLALEVNRDLKQHAEKSNGASAPAAKAKPNGKGAPGGEEPAGETMWRRAILRTYGPDGPPHVAAGQVWASRLVSHLGRVMWVETVEGKHVTCKVGEAPKRPLLATDTENIGNTMFDLVGVKWENKRTRMTLKKLGDDYAMVDAAGFEV